MHQNVNLMNENAHRQNELKSKQVILLLLLLTYTWHATWCLCARMHGRERRQCRLRCHLPAPVSLVAHAVVVALVVVLTICSLLLWQSEIATVQGEASRMALKRDALVKKVIRTSSGLNI